MSFCQKTRRIELINKWLPGSSAIRLPSLGSPVDRVNGRSVDVLAKGGEHPRTRFRRLCLADAIPLYLLQFPGVNLTSMSNSHGTGVLI